MTKQTRAAATESTTTTRHPWVLGGLLLCLAGSAAAQAPMRLSLEEAQRRALAASHRLAEARAREAAALDAVAVQRAADRPLVTFQAGYQRTNHVLEFVVPSPGGAPRVLYPDVPDNYRTRVDLQWPVYSGGRTDALEHAARAEASAVAADREAARADLRLEVERAFWALVTARATVGVVEQSVARAEANVADVGERFAAGVVPPNEVASAEAQASRQRMLRIEAENQRQVSSAELARLTGLDLLEPIEPDAALEAPSAPISAFEALVAEARAMNGERRALTRRIEAADFQRAAALGSRRPGVAITGGFDYARPNPRIFPRADTWDESWDAGITVGWTLWDGGRTGAAAAQAGGVADASRARLAEFDSVLALEVRRRLLEIDSGRAAVVAAGDTVRAAAEASRVVAERYAAGVITQTEVLDANVARLEAELDRTRALAALRLAEARLARALGR